MSLKTDHQLIVPGAVSLSEACQQALQALDSEGALPHLKHLLSRMTDTHWLRGDEYDRVTPHERVLARLRGWPDEQAPWAADLAHRDGLAPEPGEAWGVITPCHWLMGHDHLTMVHPDALNLSEAESRDLFQALQTLFEDDGWRLHWSAPTRWYACHPSLGDVSTASLDRLIGRNPDLWMPETPQARQIKRLQAEVQMLFYNHPVNDARQAQGLPTVNSFWLSGCGVATADLGAPLPLGCRVDDTLRQALLREDIPAWQAAWTALDAGPLHALRQALDAGQNVRLTLCGERHAVALQPPAATGWLHRLRRLWHPTPTTVSPLLSQL